MIDEAHHLFPASWQPAPLTVPRDLGGVLMITVHPEKVSPVMIEAVDLALAVGDAPEQTLAPFGKVPRIPLREGEVLAWSNGVAEPLKLAAGAGSI